MLEEADRVARARLIPEEKQRIAAALYESARSTLPGWPTDADRLEDLAHHIRMRQMLDRACPPERPFGVGRVGR